MALSDTDDAAEQVMLEGYRRMPPAQKLAQVESLNRAVEALATARLRAQYGADMPERELRLRLAALRFDATMMAERFGWDPRLHGL